MLLLASLNGRNRLFSCQFWNPAAIGSITLWHTEQAGFSSTGTLKLPLSSIGRIASAVTSVARNCFDAM